MKRFSYSNWFSILFYNAIFKECSKLQRKNENYLKNQPYSFEEKNVNFQFSRTPWSRAPFYLDILILFIFHPFSPPHFRCLFLRFAFSFNFVAIAVEQRRFDYFSSGWDCGLNSCLHVRVSPQCCIVIHLASNVMQNNNRTIDRNNWCSRFIYRKRVNHKFNVRDWGFTWAAGVYLLES